MLRPRARCVILQDDCILMVRQHHDGREFWTLPGGGVEEGESFEQAAVREVLEECGLAVKIVGLVAERQHFYGLERIFLAEIIGQPPGEFPLPGPEEWVDEVRWHSLESLKDDRHVSLVLKYLESRP